MIKKWQNFELDYLLGILKIFYFMLIQAAWSLKTRALTEMVYVDEIDMDEEGIAEMMLDENAIAQVARKNNFHLNTLKQQELFWSGLSSCIKYYIVRWPDMAFSYCYEKSFRLFYGYMAMSRYTTWSWCSA